MAVADIIENQVSLEERIPGWIYKKQKVRTALFDIDQFDEDLQIKFKNGLDDLRKFYDSEFPKLEQEFYKKMAKINQRESVSFTMKERYISFKS